MCRNDISDAAIVEELKCAYLADIPLHGSSGIPLTPVTWPVSIPCPFQWPHSPIARGWDLSTHRTVVSTKADPKYGDGQSRYGIWERDVTHCD